MSLPRSPSKNLARIAKSANPVRVLTVHDVKRSVFKAVGAKRKAFKAAAKLASKKSKTKSNGKNL
tara:strand:- start:97 stop:291 length:195 start_codon:yes stop_codon:yes gene_type:complete